MGSHPTATTETPSNELERRKQAVDQCQNLITHFRVRADRNKRLFQWLRNLSVILTVTVSSIAAVEGVPRWIVAVVSGMAALCTALLAATRPQEIWLQSRGTQQQLTAELFLFQQCAGDYSVSNDDERVRLLAKRITDVWSAGHQRWERSRGEIAKQLGIVKPQD
jgi:hypothetical protein